MARNALCTIFGKNIAEPWLHLEEAFYQDKDGIIQRRNQKAKDNSEEDGEINSFDGRCCLQGKPYATCNPNHIYEIVVRRKPLQKKRTRSPVCGLPEDTLETGQFLFNKTKIEVLHLVETQHCSSSCVHHGQREAWWW